MFDFALIEMPDGSQIIDTSSKTPYDSLTPFDMMEYIEMENSLYDIREHKKSVQREAEYKQNFAHKLLCKIACACGML